MALEIDAQGLTALEIQKALSEARQKKQELTLKDCTQKLEEIDVKIHKLYMEQYPPYISNACQYPECERGCFFGSNQDLCLPYIHKKKYELFRKDLSKNE